MCCCTTYCHSPASYQGSVPNRPISQLNDDEEFRRSLSTKTKIPFVNAASQLSIYHVIRIYVRNLLLMLNSVTDSATAIIRQESRSGCSLSTHIAMQSSSSREWQGGVETMTRLSIFQNLDRYQKNHVINGNPMTVGSWGSSRDSSGRVAKLRSVSLAIPCPHL